MKLVGSPLSFLNRLPSPLFRPAAGKSTMESSSGNDSDSSYTTLVQRVTCEREIKRSKFIAIAAPISTVQSAHTFLSEVRDPRATHNCWAYKIGDQYRFNDDGEVPSTAGKPIYSAIDSSGLDRVMVVVVRYFGGIKLGTGGLVRAYGGIATECLRDAPTCLVKSKVPVGLEVPFGLLGSVCHQFITVLSLMGGRATILWVSQVQVMEGQLHAVLLTPTKKQQKIDFLIGIIVGCLLLLFVVILGLERRLVVYLIILFGVFK